MGDPILRPGALRGRHHHLEPLRGPYGSRAATDSLEQRFSFHRASRGAAHECPPLEWQGAALERRIGVDMPPLQARAIVTRAEPAAASADNIQPARASRRALRAQCPKCESGPFAVEWDSVRADRRAGYR